MRHLNDRRKLIEGYINGDPEATREYKRYIDQTYQFIPIEAVPNFLYHFYQGIRQRFNPRSTHR